jgi:hypothetical protein
MVSELSITTSTSSVVHGSVTSAPVDDDSPPSLDSLPAALLLLSSASSPVLVLDSLPPSVAATVVDIVAVALDVGSVPKLSVSAAESLLHAAAAKATQTHDRFDDSSPRRTHVLRGQRIKARAQSLGAP